MKNPISWIVFAALAAVASLAAQDTPKPAASPAPLKPAENVSLHFVGKAMVVPLDLTFVEGANLNPGQGGKFVSSMILKGDPVKFMQISGNIIDTTADGYQVHVAIGFNLPVVSSVSSAGASTMTYFATQTEVTTLLKPGQPVAVSADSEVSLTVTLDKLAPGTSTARAGVNFPIMGPDGRLSENVMALVQATKPGEAPQSYTMVVAGSNMSLSMARGFVDVNMAKLPVLGTLTIQLHPAPGGGWGVQLVLGESVPIVNSRSTPGSNPTPTVTYRNVSMIADVVITKMNDPVTVYKNGGESITLTFSRADNP